MSDITPSRAKKLPQDSRSAAALKKARQRARQRASGLERLHLEIEEGYKATLDTASLRLERPLSQVVSELVGHYSDAMIPVMLHRLEDQELVRLELTLSAPDRECLASGWKEKPALSSGGVLEHLIARRLRLVDGSPDGRLSYCHPGSELTFLTARKPQDTSLHLAAMKHWNKYQHRADVIAARARGVWLMDPDVVAALEERRVRMANEANKPKLVAPPPWLEDHERNLDRPGLGDRRGHDAMRRRMALEEGAEDDDERERGEG